MAERAAAVSSPMTARLFGIQAGAFRLRRHLSRAALSSAVSRPRLARSVASTGARPGTFRG